MKTLNLELEFIEAVELKSAIRSRINYIAVDTTSTFEYRVHTIQNLIPIYDKLIDIIDNELNPEE